VGCIQGPAYEAGTLEDVPQGLGWTPPHGLNIGYSDYFLHDAMLTKTKETFFFYLMQLLADDQSC
jgi:hypothetical protein